MGGFCVNTPTSQQEHQKSKMTEYQFVGILKSNYYLPEIWMQVEKSHILCTNLCLMESIHDENAGVLFR